MEEKYWTPGLFYVFGILNIIGLPLVYFLDIITIPNIFLTTLIRGAGYILIGEGLRRRKKWGGILGIALTGFILISYVISYILVLIGKNYVLVNPNLVEFGFSIFLFILVLRFWKKLK